MEIPNYKDSSKDKLIRSSALPRTIIGTLSTTTLALIYAYAHARYRNLDNIFIKNWLKGSLIASSLFFTSNEALIVLTKHYGIYTNFWLNYTIISYTLSKYHYRYLIRNSMMKWYNAIRYSHKCFLYLCVFNLVLELCIYLYREAYLYDGEDVLDRLKDYDVNKMDLETMLDTFLSSHHVLNSSDKINKLRNFMNDHNNKTLIKTVDLYDFYKTTKI